MSFTQLHPKLANAILTVDTVGDLPADAVEGAIRYVKSTDTLYTYDGSGWNPSAGGVVGPDPATSTNNAVVRWDGTDASTLKNSAVTIDDSGNIATPGTVDGRDVSTDGAALDAHVAATSAHGSDGSVVGQNTLDVVETALQADIDTRALDSDLQSFIDQKGAANGLATLDSSSKIPTAQLPGLALTDVYTVVDEAAQLALTAEEGDIAIRTDENKTYAHNGGTAGTMADWSELLTPTDVVTSVNGQTGVVSIAHSDLASGTGTNTHDQIDTALATAASHQANTSNPHSVTKTQVGLGNVDNTSDATKNAASATLTNKTLTSPSLGSPTVSDYALLTEASAPSTPASGKVALYAKSDKKLYTKNSDGTELEIGSGASSGSTSAFVDTFETSVSPWTTYADAAAATPVDGTGGSPSVTIARNTTSPIRGTADAKLTKDAANRQGQGWSRDFTLSRADCNKKCFIRFDVDSDEDAAFASGDIVAYIYDVTNGALIVPTVTSMERSSGYTFYAAWDSTTSTSFRLILHIATTNASAWDVYIDNAEVGSGNQPQGTVVSTEYGSTSGTWDADSSTTVLSMSGSAIGGALTGSKAKTITWATAIQPGDEFVLEGSTDRSTWFPLVGGRLGAATVTVMNSVNAAGSVIAGAIWHHASTTQSIVRFLQYANVANDDSPAVDWPSDAYWRLRKISTSTVNLAQNDTQFAADDGTNDVFGPNGALVPNVASSTSVTALTLSFPGAKSDTDQYLLEANYRGNGWSSAADIFPYSSGNNATSGNSYGMSGYWSSSSLYIVVFGNRGTQVSASNVDTGATTWATERSNGTRFRIRKASSGQAVGFGAATETSRGLVKLMTPLIYSFATVVNPGASDTAFGSGSAANTPSYVSTGYSSSTLTLTFSEVGWYQVTLDGNGQQSAVYTLARILSTLAGTATRHTLRDSLAWVGDSVNDQDISGSATIMVNVTAANQTFTVAPTYRSDGNGTGRYVVTALKIQ